MSAEIRAVVRTYSSTSGDYVNSKEYRKPEWVTRMEEIQKRLSGKSSAILSAHVLADQGRIIAGSLLLGGWIERHTGKVRGHINMRIAPSTG